MNLRTHIFKLHPAGGFTLVEVIISIAIITTISGVIFLILDGALRTWANTTETEQLYQIGRTALARIAAGVRQAHWVLVPFQPSSGTSTSEILVFEASCPACDERTGDFDCIDSDQDGRFDEDTSQDTDGDGYAGVKNLDDDEDGSTDEGTSSHRYKNDDEDCYDFFGACRESTFFCGDDAYDEDPLDGSDNPQWTGYSGSCSATDGLVDEDWPSDMNGDDMPGLEGVDDDGDGCVDGTVGPLTSCSTEGDDLENDDEDNQIDEDPFDPIILRVVSNELRMLTPMFNDDGDCSRDGYDDTAIAKYVQSFEVTRQQTVDGRTLLTIELWLKNGDEEVTFTTTLFPRNIRNWSRFRYIL